MQERMNVTIQVERREDGHSVMFVVTTWTRVGDEIEEKKIEFVGKGTAKRPAKMTGIHLDVVFDLEKNEVRVW